MSWNGLPLLSDIYFKVSLLPTPKVHSEKQYLCIVFDLGFIKPTHIVKIYLNKGIQLTARGLVLDKVS